MGDWRVLMEHGWTAELAWREQAKVLEVVLRAAAPGEVAEAAVRVNDKSKDVKKLLKTMFNDVSLSPWTGFVNNALALLQSLVTYGTWSVVDEIDFLAWLLRKLSRHLTAYDLVTFHHRGANPDALLLDAALKRFLQLAEQEPELFAGESDDVILRRRALRHGVLLRRAYEGHPVPDAPTSPGENMRVLPAPFERAAEEQVSNPLRRERKLFVDEPLVGLWTATTRQIAQQCLEDVACLSELVELGMATFIDRPMGFGKTALEPDQTPLLAHEVCSLTLVRRRMELLASLAVEAGLPLPEHWSNTYQACEPQCSGDVPPIDYCAYIREWASLGRATASLADAQRVSADFVVVRTLTTSLRLLQEAFDWETLQQRFSLDMLWSSPCLCCSRTDWGNGRSGLAFWDRTGSRLTFETDPSRGFRTRGGVEQPVAGLRIWTVRDDAGVAHDLRGEEVHVLPRW